MSASSVSKGNMHNYLKRLVSLVEDVRDELRELNAYNKAKAKDNVIEKFEADMDTKPRGNKGFNNDSLRGK
jgi:predicted DNA-binding protein YlxM (UPF0122 family)